jgi:hypothetical protein
MSNTNTGGAAFPLFAATGYTGMTLRDYFAAKAMQAFISAYPCQAIDNEDGGIQTDAESIADDAYQMADAMLKARGE